MVDRPKAVKLSSFRSIDTPKYKDLSVKFFASPGLTESRTVNYIEISDIRQPTSILVWMGSPSRNFSISAKFIARSVTEADVSFRNLNLLKSWCVTNSTVGTGGNVQVFNQEDFVAQTEAKTPDDITGVNMEDKNSSSASNTIQPDNLKTFANFGDSLFKGTPEVLLLEGYGTQFRRIPVVITSLNIDFSPDVDYIKNSNGAYVPIYQEISINLKEAREVDRKSSGISSFNLKKFREGTLDFW